MAEVYHGGTIEKKQNYCVMSIILFGSMLIVGGTEKRLCVNGWEKQKKVWLYVNSWGKTVKRKLIKTSGDNQVATCF